MRSAAGGRSANQDYVDVLRLDEAACWVLADGLGGHQGGEVASDVAARAILDAFQADPQISPESLRSYIVSGQEAVQKRQRDDPQLASMRTTVVVLVSDYQSALWAHVGDSRLYFMREGRIVVHTKDHSVPQAMVAAGDLAAEEVRFHEDRNRVLRSLGGDGEVRPAVQDEKLLLQAGDAFLLCTDGFWEHVTELEMEIDYAKARDPEAWLQAMEHRLWKRVEEGHDNYSVIGIFVK